MFLKFTTYVLIALLILSCSVLPAYTLTLGEKIDSAIDLSTLSKTGIVAVSIRDSASGKLYYDHYGNYLLKTASTLKAFTTAVILYCFGTTSSIETKLYKSTINDNLLIKLSGDPFFSSNDLKTLFLPFKLKKISGNIVLDDSIFGGLPWGVGWMWDDQESELFPRYSPYNIDRNCVTLIVRPTKNGRTPKVTIHPFSHIDVINKAITSNKTLNFKILNSIFNNKSVIYVEGLLSKVITKKIPIMDTKSNFIERLKDVLKSNRIDFNGKFLTGILDKNYTFVSKVNHNILEEVSKTNKYSNNHSAESLFKIASALKSGKSGSTKSGISYFKDYYKKIGAPFTGQEIVDASGASHNNLVKTNWMSSALAQISKQSNFEKYQKTLAVPGGKGTLSSRLLNLRNRFWGKTGTLAGISGLVGYLKADSGKIYTIAILIQNYTGSSYKAKVLENKIVEIVSRY